MTANTLILATLALAATAGHARPDLLWDKGFWEGASNLTSERNTIVPESGTVDDMVLTDLVVIREFAWTSLMRDDMNALGADLIVLSEGFQTVTVLSDLPFDRVFRGILYGNFEVYDITLSGLEVELPPGRYFIGARMVGDGTSRAVSGMNGTILGESRAYWKAEYFGVPDWTEFALDLAFTVRGDIIPAPPTLVLALPCLLALRRRR